MEEEREKMSNFEIKEEEENLAPKTQILKQFVFLFLFVCEQQNRGAIMGAKNSKPVRCSHVYQS